MIRTLARRSTVAVLAGALALGGLTAAHALTVEPEEGNSIVGWGNGSFVDGAYPPWRVDIPSPDGSPFIDVAASSTRVTLAVTTEGRIVSDGTNNANVQEIPASLNDKTVVAIDASSLNAAAVTADGSVTAWGNSRGGFNGSPAALTGAESVAVGKMFALALKGDGTVFAWGASTSGVLDVPEGLSGVTAVSAGAEHALALKGDGTVVAWGEDGYGESSLPAELDGQTVISVAAGTNQSFALTEAGKVITWGRFGGTPAPSEYVDEQFVAIDVSSLQYCLGLTKAGQLIAWGGFSDSSLRDVPEELQGAPIVAIAAGTEHHAVIVNAEPDVEFEVSAKPVISGTPKVGETLTATPAEFTLEPASTTGQWLADDAPIADATATTLELTEAQLEKQITFRTTGVSGTTSLDSDSDPVGPVTAADPAPAFELTDKPVISGTAKVGETLTATPAKFTVEPDVATGQWYADGERIPRAGANTFVLTADQLGKKITFTTTAIKDSTNVLISNSDPVGPVTAADPEPEFEVSAKPVISGTPQVGETLTATPAEFTVEPDVATGQWYADGERIPRAGANTFVLTADQLGKEITFTTTAIKDSTDVLISNSDPAGPVVAADPEPELAVISAPVISGTPKVGETLTGAPATFAGDPTSVANQWFAGGDPIADATGASLELTEAMLAKNITFKSVATRGDDTAESVSEAFGPVQAADIPLGVSEQANVDGTAKQGETLTGTPAEFTGDPDSVDNQWLADGVAISGATGNSLALTEAHVGKNITFRSTATRGDDNLESVSEAAGPVLALLTVAEEARIAGTAKAGETLTGTQAEFIGGPTLIKNQWLIDGVAIDGATGTTLILTEAHVGKKITFRSTATRGDESAVSVSDVTAAVVAADPAPDPDPVPDPGEEPPAEEPGAANMQDKIDALPGGVIQPGDEITIVVGEEFAGEEVSVWLYSTPLNLGAHTVKANGRLVLTIPANVELGKHRIAVYDVDGDLIGWKNVTIGTSNSAGAGTVPVSGRGAQLPDTGADAPMMLVPLGLLMLVAGGTALVVARRRMS
ncbi:MAG: LPXTG cell wall anchor domain-containing protein [Kineosporiaceae bacterium]|nr:LPXTG cell wall anchor domain-containing protein [Aeromicrobium sp.]